MKKSVLRFPCIIAAFYFGISVNAQKAPKDSATREKKIEEVVMIGYGTAKKKDLTGSVATIKATEIVKTPSGQVGQAIQGKVAGVQIISNGSPGDPPKVNIRGFHSIKGGDNQPMYVVDGVIVDNIDFLNSSDIQDITLLKDASSSAIYGYRAANGVFVVTTKGGNYNRDAKLTYESYYGVQKASNVLKMANTEQFTNFALESGSASEIASIDAAIQRYGRSRTNPNLPNVNTDWYKETLRLAPIQNHSLSVDGGTQKISYSLGGDYFTQEGILKMKNSFQRFNFRAGVDVKAKDWLTVGGKLFYSRSEKYDDEPSAWQKIYYAVPVMPVYDPAYSSSPQHYSDAVDLGYRGGDHQNPFELMDNSDKLSTRRRITMNAYADISLIPKDLSFKSSFSYNNKADDERNVLLPYYVKDSYQRTISESSIERVNALYENYIWDNTLTYNKKFGNHDITLMGGTSFNDESYRRYFAKGFFDPKSTFSRDREETWYIANTSVESRTTNDDSNPNRYFSTSYFARFAYKFKNRYILYATDRLEGSNKRKDIKKDINLPAFGAAWVISEEPFLNNNNFINFLKFRAGWGKLANNDAPINRARSAFSNSTIIDGQFVDGFYFSTYQDHVSWEFTEESNMGLSSELLNRHLTIEADYFIKNTKNMAIDILPLVGTESSVKDVGRMRNKGIEISATWKDKIGENFGYYISGNFSKIKNEITDLGGQNYLSTGMAEFPQRFALGESAYSFYGFNILGVYQNQAEIAADPAAQYAINTEGKTIKPGFFKYQDINGDGKITADDMTNIGSALPKYYFGGSIGLNYKNWDFALSFYGQGGNMILNRNRAEVFRTSGRNIDAELAINRWHGDGTTNEFPSSEGYRNSWNWRNSKFFLEKGDFIRIQNIQIGYTLKTSKLPEMRFSITADRPFLFAKSKLLFNPEVNNNGVDLEIYPTPSVFSFGYSVKF